MHDTNFRKATRSRVWPDIEATVKVSQKYHKPRAFHTIKGAVCDLGGGGMFLVTPEDAPVPAKAEITIDFDPRSKSTATKIRAFGETVRLTNEGIGIRFTFIDLFKLQQCIIYRMNQMVD
jgi:c-di-GMP-binding flagellar brake protein YcgR